MILATAALNPVSFRLNAPAEFSAVADSFSQDWDISIDPKASRQIQVAQNLELGEEEFDISVGDEIVVSASTARGAAWGLSHLGESLTTGSREPKSTRQKPDVKFRAINIDVARRYHSPSTLRMLIRWCSTAKLSAIQLHLTDDQNWMLPTDVLKGIDRHNEHGRPTYTKQELIDLQKYAEARGVSIIPEIDMPGHSSLMVKHDPAVFQIQGSESKGCVNFGSPQVRGKLKALLTETAKLFPNAPYIHLGGDEAWYPNAEKDPLMQASMKALGKGKGPQEVFVDFLGEMAEHVLDLKKTPIVWEGFHASEYAKQRIPKSTIVVAWEGPYYPAKQLQPDGFRVINAGWDPHYVVNHLPYDVNTLVPLERILNSNPQTFGIVHWSNPADATFQFKSPIEGSLMCWWEGPEWNAQRILPARILAFGQVLWNRKDRPTYEAFIKRYQQLDQAIESPRLGLKATIKGTLPKNNSQFTEQVKLNFSGVSKSVRFAVRRDGQTPTLEDLIEGNQVLVDQSCTLAVLAFDGNKPVSETWFRPFKRVTFQRSLTTGAKITSSGERDHQFGIENLVDGISDDPTGYWLTYPSPQTATIDLGSLQPIRRIQVVTQWQNGAPTSYRVAGSVDGKTWTDLVNRSANDEKSTPEGYTDTLKEPVSVRHLRITALGGKLFPNTISRIVEVRAFKE